MLCDGCLLLIGNGLSEEVRRVLYRLNTLKETTIRDLARDMDQSVYETRKALVYLKGATLSWGDWSAYSVSPAGEKFIELQVQAEKPEVIADMLCDTCLLEIGEALSEREADILGCFSSRPITRHQLVVDTGLSLHKVREGLMLLQGARLVGVRSSRVFHLSPEGQRLDYLLRKQLVSSGG